jgi:hypothetical protein
MSIDLVYICVIVLIPVNEILYIKSLKIIALWKSSLKQKIGWLQELPLPFLTDEEINTIEQAHR